MLVRELASDLTISTDTVRYYTRIGFLSPDKNPVNHYKEYSIHDKDRLSFILSARQLGFAVSDIRQLLEEADKGISPCPLARELIERRLQQTEQQFQQTLLLRKRMQGAIVDWADKPDKNPTGHMLCHLIQGYVHPKRAEQ